MSVSASSTVSSVALPTAQVDVTVPAVTGRTITVNAGGDLQAAINAAQPGDEIVLQAGAVFTGSYTLPDKAGNGWVTIRSSGTLPAAGVRVTAADAGAMATLMAPGSNAPALQTEAGAHNYRIVGLNITAAPGVTQMTSLVNLGDGNATQNTLAAQPHDIVIDRSYIHGSDALDLRRGVALNSANSAVINSTVSDIHSADSDSQAIAGWNGTGPYLIQNNDLQASGENVMFGGADPSIPNALPSDITIRGNDFSKPVSWKGVWEVKNLLELKIGQRVLVEGNTFSNTWVDAQSGFAINVKSTDQNGTAPWSNTSDVTIRNNVIANAASGISVSASPEPNPAVPTANVSITDNTFTNIGGTEEEAPSGTLFLVTGYGGALRNLTIANNTAISGDSNLATTVSFDGTPTQNLVFTGNTLTQGLYGIKGSGTGEGQATLAAYAPGAIFSGNTLIGADQANYTAFSGNNSFPTTSAGIATPPGSNASGTGSGSPTSSSSQQDAAGQPYSIPQYAGTPTLYSDFGTQEGWSIHNGFQILKTEQSDPYASVLGFGDNGIIVGAQAFAPNAVSGSTYLIPLAVGNADGWDQTTDIRTFEDNKGNALDFNHDGIPDFLGMGPNGTVFALGTVDQAGHYGLGTLQTATFGNTGTDLGRAQGWTDQTTARQVAHDSATGYADLIVFGNAGVSVAMGQDPSTHNGQPFGALHLALADFGTDQGWSAANTPRLIGDVNGDGTPDIVGFGASSTFVAIGSHDGAGNLNFTMDPTKQINDFGYNEGWDAHTVRALANVDGSARDSLVLSGAYNTMVYHLG